MENPSQSHVVKNKNLINAGQNEPSV